MKLRGESEKRALDLVKNNLESIKLFGLDRNEFREIVKCIEEAKPNESESEFPDFVFKDGFIEHFEVTGAKETRKGSHLKQRKAKFNRECQNAWEEVRNKNINTLKPGNMSVDTREMTYQNFSLEDYQKSFKKHFDSHINSLKKYEGNKEKKIFLIEYVGALFGIYFDDVYQKDFYELHLDKEILEYIYKFKNLLDYIIFTDNEHREIIKIDGIPQIIKTINSKINFQSGRLREINMMVDVFFDF